MRIIGHVIRQGRRRRRAGPVERIKSRHPNAIRILNKHADGNNNTAKRGGGVGELEGGDHLIINLG